MALSRSIRDLFSIAEETSAVDDNALDALGRRALEAMIVDPELPDHIRERAARLLSGSEAPSCDASHSNETPD